MFSATAIPHPRGSSRAGALTDASGQGILGRTHRPVPGPLGWNVAGDAPMFIDREWFKCGPGDHRLRYGANEAVDKSLMLRGVGSGSNSADLAQAAAPISFMPAPMRDLLTRINLSQTGPG